MHPTLRHVPPSVSRDSTQAVYLVPAFVGLGSPHWEAEAIEWKPNGLGCRISRYRADLVALADALDAELPAPQPADNEVE